MRVMMYYWRYDEIMRGPGVIIVLYLCLRRYGRYENTLYRMFVQVKMKK